MKLDYRPRVVNLYAYLTIAVVCSLFIGGVVGYLISNSLVSSRINDLQANISTLEKNVSSLQSGQIVTGTNNTYYLLGENVSLSHLYEQVKDSVVVVQGIIVEYDMFNRAYYAEVQGSGFLYNFTGQPVIVTNYHVVYDATNITVTFIDGNSYAATITGSDIYADLAVLSADMPETDYKPLTIVSSSTLKVGDPVVALGNPYGLAGSMTSGIISALGRTLTEDMTGGYTIANCIQTTAPINPGNSGGPLLNYRGEVVGITTAIVSSSQGVGLAIPSSTILREIESLITTGSYHNHPWLGIAGTDMTFEIAKSTGTSATYGVLLTQVTAGGPADKAGLKAGTSSAYISGSWVTVGGDIIIALNGMRITSMDDLSTYLEEHTSVNQTVNVTVARNNETQNFLVVLLARP